MPRAKFTISVTLLSKQTKLFSIWRALCLIENILRSNRQLNDNKER